MSDRAALDSYIETLQILAHEGDGDRTDEERKRDAAFRAKLIDAHAHELAEQHAAMLRAYPDYRGVMDLAAALVLGEDHPQRRHDHPAHPSTEPLVRPDEEPTP